MLFFEEEGDFAAVYAQFVEGAVAVVYGVCECVVELLVEFVVGVDGASGKVEVGEGLLEELAVLLVGDSAAYLAAEVVKLPLSDVQDAHELLLENFELAELVEPVLAGLVRGGLELHPLLHQLVHLFIEESDLDDLAVSREVLGGAARAD